MPQRHNISDQCVETSKRTTFRVKRIEQKSLETDMLCLKG